MSQDRKTLDVYDARATQYAALVENTAKDPILQTFIAALAKGACVLDLGCGPGVAAAEMARAGLKPTATDASREMVELAGKHPGVTATQAGFDEIDGEDIYDGIWANFSLLHAAREDMPGHLTALRAALRPGGLFHIGMKTGSGSHRDDLGRLYTYYTQTELSGLLSDAGLTPFSSTTGQEKGLDGKLADWVVIAAHG